MNTRTGVHHPPESAFMIKRIRRSQSNGIDVHNQQKRAIIADIRSAAGAAVGRLIMVTCDCLSLP